MYLSTKTYGHEVGLSATFRQHRALSHCNRLHGYALSVKLLFSCAQPDSRNWVVDFGALKPVKAWLEYMFDHKTLIAEDDPLLETFRDLSIVGGCSIRVVDAVGCEAFAKLIYDHVAESFLPGYIHEVARVGLTPPMGLMLDSVEVREHGANSAVYVRPNTAMEAA